MVVVVIIIVSLDFGIFWEILESYRLNVGDF